MTSAIFARSDAAGADAAGAELVEQLADETPPDALILFASPRYDYEKLMAALAPLKARNLVGCSSAGEFVGASPQEGTCCAVALRSSEMQFSSRTASAISQNPRAVAEKLTHNLLGLGPEGAAYPFRTALIFCDALAGNTEELIDEVTRRTAGLYQLVGGGAGDDGRFSHTHVFHDKQAISDGVVLLEMLSQRPVGVGVSHGWEPAGTAMRVTESRGSKVIGLNAEPASEVFQVYASDTRQPFDPANPLPFFLHNVVGIKTAGGWKLRVPLAIDLEQGSVDFASDVPEGCLLSFMRTTTESGRRAAEKAAVMARQQLGANTPGAALFFDCVATRLRMGSDFGLELETLQEALSGARFAGYNTYGQIARAEGQFSGFHNCTAVVCLLPR